MKIKKNKLLISLICVLIGCGCDDTTNYKGLDAGNMPTNSNKNLRATFSSNDGSYDGLSNNAILISVNGRDLRKEEFSRWVDLRQAILANSFQGQHKVDSRQLTYVQNQMLSHVTNDFVREVVISEYAAKMGIVATSNEIQRCWAGFQANSGNRGKSWKMTMAGFNKVQSTTITERVAAEALMLAASAFYLKEHPVVIDEKEVKEVYEKYLEYNRNCAASNTLIWAMASNVWHRLKAGEDFIVLADKFNEDEYKSADAEWGTFRISDLADEPDIWKLSRNFKKGWISPPVEGDNGLMIIKIESIEDGSADTNALDYVPSPDAEFLISRIFFHLPLFMENVDFEHLRREFKVAKEVHAFNTFVGDLIKKAKIVYPSGLQIFNAGDSDSRPRNSIYALP